MLICNIIIPPIRDLKDNNYLTVKANRCVFRTDLTFSRDDTFLISAGNLFHKVRAATLNAQAPYDLRAPPWSSGSVLDHRSLPPVF